MRMRGSHERGHRLRQRGSGRWNCERAAKRAFSVISRRTHEAFVVCIALRESDESCKANLSFRPLRIVNSYSEWHCDGIARQKWLAGLRSSCNASWKLNAD